MSEQPIFQSNKETPLNDGADVLLHAGNPKLRSFEEVQASRANAQTQPEAELTPQQILAGYTKHLAFFRGECLAAMLLTEDKQQDLDLVR